MQLNDERATVLAVVGNPKPASRTRAVAEAVAARIATCVPQGADVEVLEVADIGPNLLGWGDPAAAATVGRLTTADAIVVASPVYKATYTGLLKLLFDQVGAGQLGGAPTVPVMVGAAPHHAMAVDVHLRPLLVEVGASCPTTGLYVLDSALDELDETLDAWCATQLPLLAAPIASTAAVTGALA